MSSTSSGTTYVINANWSDIPTIPLSPFDGFTDQLALSFYEALVAWANTNNFAEMFQSMVKLVDSQTSYTADTGTNPPSFT